MSKSKVAILQDTSDHEVLALEHDDSSYVYRSLTRGARYILR